jgi:hypothetical protein
MLIDFRRKEFLWAGWYCNYIRLVEEREQRTEGTMEQGGTSQILGSDETLRQCNRGWGWKRRQGTRLARESFY